MNVIGDVSIISITIISVILISLRKKTGLILAMIPAMWAILLQWFLVYIISGYEEPNGVWWYPLFPIFQGIMIGYFTILAYRGDEGQPDQEIWDGVEIVLHLPVCSGSVLVSTDRTEVRKGAGRRFSSARWPERHAPGRPVDSHRHRCGNNADQKSEMGFGIGGPLRGHSPDAAHRLSLNHGEALPGRHLVVSFFHRISRCIYHILFTAYLF